MGLSPWVSVLSSVSLPPPIYESLRLCETAVGFVRSLPHPDLRFPVATGSPGGTSQFCFCLLFHPLPPVLSSGCVSCYLVFLIVSLSAFFFGCRFLSVFCVLLSGSLFLCRPPPWLRPISVEVCFLLHPFCVLHSFRLSRSPSCLLSFLSFVFLRFPSWGLFRFSSFVWGLPCMSLSLPLPCGSSTHGSFEFDSSILG